MSRPRLIALLLAFVTLAVYLPATRNDFLHYDDDDYVVNNLIVQKGLTLAGINWAFTTFHAFNWHPVTWLSHMIDCQFFGLNAGAHHFVNVLFHSANAALLFMLLWRLTGTNWPSALVAALFAWHPLHVESVAWVAERKDVLSTFFALLALLNYVKFTKEKSRQNFWCALALFALGLMAKPMLVTLPFIMLLLDFWPLRRIAFTATRHLQLAIVFEKWPFFLLTFASCIITCFAQHPAMVELDKLPLSFRLENAVGSATHYLWEIFWPVDLAVAYPFIKFPAATFLFALVTLTLISATVWLVRNRSRSWMVGWFWFLGTLVPVIGIVQVGSAAMADRYTYIPSIGIFIALVFGLYDLGKIWPWILKISPPIATLALVACVLLTEKQLCYWKDSETLFRHALTVTKNNDTAHDNLGLTFELQGRTTEALAEYREAVRLNPYHYQLHFSIGNMLDKLGQPTAALAEYRLCISRDSNVPALHNAAGGSLLALGRVDEALVEFAQATRLEQNYVAPHLGSAKALLLLGRDRDAISQLHIALRIDPDNFEVLAYTAHILAANENASVRDGQKALGLARKANELSGGIQPMVLDILGMAYAETGDFTNAVACTQNAIELASQANLKSTEAIRQRLELYKHQQSWREPFATIPASSSP